MELKKLAPWNWFKKEEEMSHAVPVKHGDREKAHLPEHQYQPMVRLHRDIDQLFNHFFRGFASSGADSTSPFSSLTQSVLFKPQVDLSAPAQEYVLTVEIAGVSEKDISVDVSGGTMTIQGEKKQEKEEKEKDYYRIERQYGAFQRVLSLPEDVDQENIKADFKNGVLTVTMPRKALPAGEVKQIEINAGP
ncbi:Hsp20/alpha crystallin family protein [Desulfobulbus alkaliphilus]|uniref:Hsp20/alpha crystallin family protein n=1 Tax=Desulfobulbus alkaliphilus TaxID=869814 RepID=UPI001963A2F7|nr:Hsp20/alpha crystallin family protein [Desulfobulbus alkaliphilus]MBM9538402.1 Hsp20/alpha crystallin family protein [Desulfobulbus alkaliphilus]